MGYGVRIGKCGFFVWDGCVRSWMGVVDERFSCAQVGSARPTLEASTEQQIASNRDLAKTFLFLVVFAFYSWRFMALQPTSRIRPMLKFDAM